MVDIGRKVMAYGPQRRTERSANSDWFYTGVSARTIPVVQKEHMNDLVDEAFQMHRKYHGSVLVEKLSNIARRMESAGHVSRFGFQSPTTVYYRGWMYDLALRS